MKKDVALGIALILLGTFGLVNPPDLGAGWRHLKPKPARAVQVAPKAALALTPGLVKFETAKQRLRSCDRGNSSNLIEQVSLGLADLDSIVSLQSIGSGI